MSILFLFNTVTMTEGWFQAKLRVQTGQNHYRRRICGNPRRARTGGQSPAVFAQNGQTLCLSDWMNFFLACHSMFPYKDLKRVTLKEFTMSELTRGAGRERRCFARSTVRS